MGQEIWDKDTPLQGSGMGYRLPARKHLQSLIERRQRELTGLQELFALLPETLSPEADEALWQLLIGPHYRV